MSGIKGAVVLVTGSSSGIGAGIAIEFAKNGAKLALAGRNIDKLKQTAKRCEAEGVRQKDIFTVTGDLTKQEEVDNIVASVIKYYGRLDILINNAGATRARNIDTLEVEDLDWVYDILVRSVFMMTKACTPHLEKTKGRVVNTSSLSGLRPLNYALPYSTCKHMVDVFTNCAGIDLAKKGIRMNSVNPAAVKTDMFMNPDGPGGTTDKMQKYLDWCCKAIPLGRIGLIDEVARSVIFLVSHEASFVAGINYAIDGGYSNTAYVGKAPAS